jgi:hypothetical protein
MQSAFGWTLLSRDALRRAETQLHEDVEGVRDEIGFLGLHQAYADRFFPGTSVLHKRLRYVLFVPWIYEKVSQQADGQAISAAVEKQELILTGRLKSAKESGIIGERNYPEPTTQPPTMVYWSALATWRILRPLPDGSFPSRQSVHRFIARKTTHHQSHDDDKELLFEDEPLFSSVPKAPNAWSNPSMPLDFRLQEGERRYLRNRFLSVFRPRDQVPSLLARLVEHRLEITNGYKLWASKIRATADAADRDALTRARQAAGLTAIGRGVYAALVEEMRAKHDGIRTENIHRTELLSVMDQFRAESSTLDVNGILSDAPLIPRGILEVLRATQSWLQSHDRDPMALYEVYERAESSRKGRRARLTKSLAGRERRAEWMPDKHPTATPLHYRWGNVSQLLMDLRETS